MALRVLLADESTTIKKVMQLALQDFGVEVKSVAIGLDVVSVAKSFKPDVVFVDVLLQKRSGYEVVRDVKSNFAGVPVVLMWSGFMELDEAKASGCGADRRLEKPFDAEALRHLVKELVPKTAGNVISDYLTFPALPEFEEEPGLANMTEENPSDFVPAKLTATIPAEIPAEAPPADIYAIPEIDENAPELMASSMPGSSPADESWSHQDLSKFKVDLGGDMAADGGVGGEFVAQVQSDGDFEEVTFTSSKITPAPAAAAKPTAPPPKAGAPAKPTTPPPMTSSPGLPRPSIPPPATGLGAGSAMDEVLAEKVMREEARAILERVVWQMLPEIAERIVKEELQKILKDAERGV